MSDRIHVYPVRQRNQSDHRTTKDGSCWCVPELMNVCSESDQDGNHSAICWRCQGRGLVPIYDASLTVLLIHKNGQFFDEHQDRSC